jgi:hypothetical protein
VVNPAAFAEGCTQVLLCPAIPGRKLLKGRFSA